MITRQYLLTTLLCLSIWIIAGCDHADSNPENARISEKGVDGVEFGDTLADIRRILGDPQVTSNLDGSQRSWFGSGYSAGDHAGLWVYTINIDGPPDSLDPVDLYAIRAPFVGTTSQGIGVGSTIDDLLDAMGEPELIRTPNDTLYYYCMGKRDVELVVREDTVTTFFFGFHEPLPSWHTQCQD